MDTFSYSPSTGTQTETVPRVRRARFGEGYQQVTPDGINPMLRTWELVFSPIHALSGTPVTMATLDAFFRAHVGQFFLWTQLAPCATEGAKVFECTRWSWVYEEGGSIIGCRATFEQQPET